jgi:predicted membrane-bound spermidine synthase
MHGTTRSADKGLSDTTSFALLTAAFFVSGFAALLYQVVWQRMLGIFAGSDAVTAALVVGAFLLGIGIGSLAATGLADRLSARRAALAFAGCELAIALFAVGSKFFLYDLLALRLGPVLSSQAAIFAACVAGLLFPTVAMGLSLPLLAKAVVPRIEAAAERIGLLYGLNTLGAAAGALVGGFVIVGQLGFQGALWVGAVLNLSAAIGAVLLAPGLADHRVTRAAGTAVAGGGLPGWAALVFASGFLIVALEIVWLRVLGLSAQNNAYVFALVLGVFLLADGAGLVVGARIIHRVRDLRGSFLRLQGVALLAALAGLAVLWAIYPALDALQVEKFRFDSWPMVLVALLTLLLVGPAAFLLGMTFPITQRAVQQDLGSLGMRVALVNLANILGNAAGGMVAGLALLHWLGTAGTLAVLAGVALALTLLALPGPRRGATLAVAGTLAAAILLFPGNQAFWARVHAVQPGQASILAEDRSGVALLRNDGDRAPLFIGGHAQSRLPFHPHHYFLGALGPALHPAPANVMIIGVGSGGTPFGGGWNPATRLVDAIELVGPVYDVIGAHAAANPASVTAAIMRDPKFRLRLGDGRRALLEGDTRYDVIEADAILPQTSHSGMLYSVEFLRQVGARLAPGGLFVQWAPTERVAAGFMAAFPHGVLLRPISVLVGSDRPVPFDPDRLRAILADPAFVAHARVAGVDTSGFAALFAEPAMVWTPDTPRRPVAPNEDLFPRDEYYLNNVIRDAQGRR